MRALAFALLASFSVVGCESLRENYSLDTGDGLTGAPTPPEERGLNYTEIDGDWRLQSDALNVTRDVSKKQVLRASAQMGATLTSLRAPRHTQVPTTARADAIYYDGFHNRFQLVGNPVIEQGTKVTSRVGADAKLTMYSDGNIHVRKIESLVP